MPAHVERDAQRLDRQSDGRRGSAPSTVLSLLACTVPPRPQLRVRARRQGLGRLRLDDPAPPRAAERFLGFGLPLDAPSFGRLLSAAKANLHAPWLGISVFVTLAMLLTLLIFVGEAVRDALDPRRALAATSDKAGEGGEIVNLQTA